MKVKLVRIGNSMGVRLPSSDIADMEEGQEFSFSRSGRKLILTKPEQSVLPHAQFFSRMFSRKALTVLQDRDYDDTVRILAADLFEQIGAHIDHFVDSCTVSNTEQSLKHLRDIQMLLLDEGYILFPDSHEVLEQHVEIPDKMQEDFIDDVSSAVSFFVATLSGDNTTIETIRANVARDISPGIVTIRAIEDLDMTKRWQIRDEEPFLLPTSHVLLITMNEADEFQNFITNVVAGALRFGRESGIRPKHWIPQAKPADTAEEQPAAMILYPGF